MVTGFNHTGIVVQDLDTMVDFYCGQLGLSELNRVESNAPPEGNHTGIPGSRRTLVFVGMEEGHRIELVKYHEPESHDGYLDVPQLGAMHICFNVDDMRETQKNLTAKGIRFVTDPIFRTDDDGIEHGIVYAQDPEGNWLEFIQPGH